MFGMFGRGVSGTDSPISPGPSSLYLSLDDDRYLQKLAQPLIDEATKPNGSSDSDSSRLQ